VIIMLESENRFDPTPTFYEQFIERKFQRASQAICQELQLAQRPQTETLQSGPSQSLDQINNQDNGQTQQQQEQINSVRQEPNIILGCY
jgi:hypothetical protein